MLGVALALIVSPAYIGALVIGAAIGAAIRIDQRRKRAAAAPLTKGRRRKRR
jgi:uncharacterized membrane protein YqgA involved in biofilm formation